MTMLILGIFIGATIGYLTAALMAAPNYSEKPNNSSAKEDDVELWAKRNNFTIVADEWWENATDIICKYQKITEIMSELNGDFYGSYLKDRQALEKIYEVVEDGNE